LLEPRPFDSNEARLGVHLHLEFDARARKTAEQRAERAEFAVQVDCLGLFVGAR
jgi:hypothetical protein